VRLPSNTHLLYHIIFSTKNREPSIDNDLRTRLHAGTCGISLFHAEGLFRPFRARGLRDINPGLEPAGDWSLRLVLAGRFSALGYDAVARSGLIHGRFAGLTVFLGSLTTTSPSAWSI
jgi:hypothetical protein